MYGSETNRPLIGFRWLAYGLLISASLVLPFLLRETDSKLITRSLWAFGAYVVFLLIYSYVPLRDRGPLTFQRLGLVLGESALACLFIAFFAGPEPGFLIVVPIAVAIISIEHGWRMAVLSAAVSGGFAIYLLGPNPSTLALVVGSATLAALGPMLLEAHRIRIAVKSDEELEHLDRAYHIARRETSRRHQNEEELFREKRRFEGLVEVALGLAQIREQDKLLQRIVNVASDQLSARGAAVLMVEGNQLRARGEAGLTEPMLLALERCTTLKLLEKLTETGVPLVFNRGFTTLESLENPELLEPFAPLLDPSAQRPGGVMRIDQMLIAPLTTAQQQKAFGVLIVLNQNLDQPFTEVEGRYVHVLATNAATALKNILFTAELERSHWELIQALAQAIEAKDSYTSNHVGRVRDLSVEIARAIGLDRGTTRVIAIAATLHDVGKISTPDSVLMKPGPLTDDEYDIMKQHAENGAQILRGIRSLPNGVEDMVRHHHERWDGKGYPQGLAGAKIPLGAQIISIADCFDAMTYDRPYRKGFSKQEAFHKMEMGCGTQFNPKLLCAFFAVQGWIPQTETSAIDTYKAIIGKLRLASTFRGPEDLPGRNPKTQTGSSAESREQDFKPLLLERN